MLTFWLRLLDGLDELPAEFHRECLAAIFEYTAGQGHMVLTCRQQELIGNLLAA